MPYINKELRLKFDACIGMIVKDLQAIELTKVDGCLNYVITKILRDVYPPKYFNFNRAVGVLESCKMEYYRRLVAPYEDTKIVEEGDVYVTDESTEALKKRFWKLWNGPVWGDAEDRKFKKIKHQFEMRGISYFDVIDYYNEHPPKTDGERE